MPQPPFFIGKYTRILWGVGGIIALAGLLAVALALIHIFAGKLRFLNVSPRSKWLSGASGVSVAYVFVHILPELATGEESLRQWTRQLSHYFEHHVYLIALAGLVIFYGLERMAKVSRAQNAARGQGDVTGAGVFWIHIGSFGVYNALIGYLLLHREKPGLTSLLLFFAAMATHFLVNDFGLERDHKRRYTLYGRWVLAAAVLIGWAIGALERGGAMPPIPEPALAALFAFLAGGVVLNVLKEELPEERQSNFWAFLIGIIAYTALLLNI